MNKGRETANGAYPSRRYEDYGPEEREEDFTAPTVTVRVGDRQVRVPVNPYLNPFVW